jgi:signal transduction histidine kinase
VYVAEGFVAAVTAGVCLPQGSILPYLIVPALLTGAAGSIVGVVLVAGCEAVGLLLILLSGPSTTRDAGLGLAAPWLVATLGAGAMAWWLSQLRSPTRLDDVSYESARRLLGQLRTVARRLSSGLDPVSMAEQILVLTHESLTDARSALFTRTEGGVLSPLSYRGFDAQQSLLPHGDLVERCWAEAEPAHAPQPSGRAGTRHRVVLPLRSGSRMLGVVVSETAAAPTPATLTELMRELDEQALRLDTALVFDEVRSLATMEERQRLAREIHDGVAQELASLGYLVDELSATTLLESDRVKLQGLRAEMTRVVSELRLSIFDLRSDVTSGLGSALSDYVRAVGARSGLTVHLTLDESPTRLRGEVETELLRIAQEAVTNARRHSGAANLWVDCCIKPPYARLRIEDDGTGLGQPRADSYGLKIMKERADRIGARLEIGQCSGSDGDKGTRVTVTVGGDDASPALEEANRGAVDGR